MTSINHNATMHPATIIHGNETYTTINKQSFFCINDDCGNIAAAGHPCVSCDSARGTPKCTECNYRHAADGDTKCSICTEPEPMCTPEECPGCGCEMWGALLGTNGYCGVCWQQRYGLLACHGSSSVADTGCTCDGSGLVCPSCNEEYHESCRGCGAFTNLGLGDYCSDCYLPPLPPSPPQVPRHMSMTSMQAEITEIEARLQTSMTKRQKDDWTWILQRRRADLAEARKEMWEQYDEDDLNKLDRQR